MKGHQNAFQAGGVFFGKIDCHSLFIMCENYQTLYFYFRGIMRILYSNDIFIKLHCTNHDKKNTMFK
jgi:hypothetical protein